MQEHERLIKAVFKNEFHEVNDCIESGADVSENKNEALRIAISELYSARVSLIRAEAVVDLLRSKKNG